MEAKGLQLVFMTKVEVTALGGIYGEKGRGLVKSLSKRGARRGNC